MATDDFKSIVNESNRNASFNTVNEIKKFDTSIEEVARKNTMFAHEINQASKGGVSSLSKEETKIFYAATKNLWEGKDPRQRNEIIVQKMGVESLEEAWETVFANEYAQEALENARKNQQPIDTEVDIQNGATDEKEEIGSPDYIKELLLALDTINYEL